jgi:restriction system protein
MLVIWGIHNDHPELELVEHGFVSIGWPGIGDLNRTGGDRESIKLEVESAYPRAKAGAIPVWAGVLYRFAFEMKVGDYILYPYKPDRTLHFGRVEGDYYFDADAEMHRHRRKVKWLQVDVPRDAFSQAARYEIGSAVTLFKVKNHSTEFLPYFTGETPGAPASEPETVDEAAEEASEELNAERIELISRDFVIDALMNGTTGFKFEYFIADLLRAMGYRAKVTQATGDGGVDVVAHRDPLGLEPPLIKVQCKRTLGKTGAPDVQKLTGTLAPGGSELGLFVTLGSYSSDAQHIGRNWHNLQLLNGNDIVTLIFEHYEQLAPEWKRMIPLKRVYVVDRDPEIG